MQDTPSPAPIVHVIEQWSVFEVPPPEGQTKWYRHFTGICSDQPFISDAVIGFDAAGASAQTARGHIVQLQGEPDLPKEVRRLWSAWKTLHHITYERDVTREFHSGLLLVRAGSPL